MPDRLIILRFAQRRANQAFNRVMKPFDVTPLQATVLMTLLRCPNCQQSDLASMTSMHPSTAVGVIDRLVMKGFVQQERDANHANCNRINLTESGTVFARKLYGAYEEVERFVFAKMKPQEVRHFKRLLRKLVRAQRIDARNKRYWPHPSNQICFDPDD